MLKSRYLKWALLGVTLLALSLLASTGRLVRAAFDAGLPVSASQELSYVWERAQETGSYRFTADIIQTAVPVASVENVGRQSRKDALYVEGQANLSKGTLEMTLWSNGGNVLDASSGIQVRVDGEEAFVRQGEQAWQPVDNFTGLFAPESDFMTYLIAATDIVDQGTQRQAGYDFRRFGFNVDGPAYAEYVRNQMQAELRRNGELPPGVQLELPQQYAEMSGSGELWVDPRGLPLRQVLQLEMPGRDTEQITADITVNFSEFGPGLQPAEVLAGSVDVGTSLGTLTLLALAGALFFVLVARSRSRTVYAAVMFIIIGSMLFAPLLEARSVQAFSERQSERAREQAAREEESEMQQALDALVQNQAQIEAGALVAMNTDAGLDADLDGLSDVEERFLGTNPQSLSVEAGQQEAAAFELPANDATDSDADGLTDYTEALLGTLVEFADSDGDDLDDRTELEGFVYNGRTWYTDPLQIDSNGDGIDDGREWELDYDDDGMPDDTDDDDTPDLFDDDNDGDGVPDNLDLSPFTTNSTIFNAANPLELTLDNLEVGQITYVEFQLRPTDPDHLWYAFNVLDWPEGDRTGTMQDDDGQTYFGLDTSLPSTPNANGDLQLVPMLEVRIPDATDHLPDDTALERYGIAVQPLPNGQQGVYVPLQLSSDEYGNEQVAFYGKMLYLPEAVQWGTAHQVRLVWVVQALVDVCAEFTDGVCTSYSAHNDMQVIHTYDDPFQLTGLNVRENHGSDVALVYESPLNDSDFNDDSLLWKFSHGLEGTFLAGSYTVGPDGTPQRDITVQTIYERFDLDANDGVPLELRWNLDDLLKVRTASYPDVDAAVMTTATTATKNLLDTEFTTHWTNAAPIVPTILFAREDVYRSFNLDELTGENAGLLTINDRQLTVNLAPGDVKLQTMASVNWAPFQYDGSAWSAYPIELYWDELAARHGDEFAVEYPDPEEAGGALGLAQTYYVALYRGMVSIVQAGDLILQRQYFTSDKPLAAKFAAAAQGGTVFITKIIVNALLQPSRALKWFNSLLTNFKTYRVANPLSTLGEGLGALFRQFQIWWQTSRLAFGLALAATVAVVAAVAVAGYFLVTNYLSGDPGARIAAAVVVGTITGYLGVVAPILAMRDMYRVVSTANQSAGRLAALRTVALASGEINKAAKIAGAVGLIIAIGVIWGVFIYAAITSGVPPGSVAFNALLAQAIAATIVAILMFVVSLTIVGAILVALISVIDLILTLLGNDFTISGWVTENLAKAIYHFELTVDSDVDTGAFDLDLLEPEYGLEAGREARVSLPISTTVTHDNPDDLRTIIYLPEYWTSSNLRSTTFRYTLAEEETSLSAGRSDMRGEWAVTSRGSYLSNPMYRGFNMITPTLNITLEAGINKTVPVHLGSAYALPGVECWTIYQPLIPPYYFPVCIDKTIRGSNDSEVGEALVLDVMPASLDEFYALEWGGAISFPTPLDHDGDGLINRSLGGNDPDDTIDQCNGGPCWDSDGDGLSDRYEVRFASVGVAGGGARMSPLAADTDVDGLCDADEIRLGTRPDKRDTDGDGLTDGQEVWHQDRCDNNGNGDPDEWLGGWDFTAIYTDTLGTEQTLVTRINSDPLAADVDGDGLSDLAERTLHESDPVAYPFNPHVFNESPLALYLALDDEDRVVSAGQTLGITATVQNNLSTPLYALGGVTMTLPAPLYDIDFSRSFNLFQGESAVLHRSITVPGGSTVETAIDGEFFARLHDGNTADTWAWDPPLLFEDKNLSGIYPRQATLAPLPLPLANPNIVPNDYALATLEGNDPSTISSAEPLIYADPQGRQAVATIGDATNLSLSPSGLTGSTPPAIAANNAGETLSVWSNAHWYNCADVELNYIFAQAEGDQSGGSEYYINRTNTTNGADWNEDFSQGWGELVWAQSGSINTGESVPIDVTRTFCEGDSLAVWEQDGTDFMADDYVCNISPLDYASGTFWSASCSDGADTDLIVNFRVNVNANQDWLGRDNYNCAELYLDKLEVIQAPDQSGGAEYYINLNGHHRTIGGGFPLVQNPASGTRIWTYSASANSGETLIIDETLVRVCRGDTIDIWEDDGDGGPDDYICSLPMLDNPTNGLPAATAAGVAETLTCNGTGGDTTQLKLHLTVRPNPKYTVAGSILNVDGSAKRLSLPLQSFERYDTACAFGVCFRKEYRHMDYPAVASDGTNFLAAWQNEQGIIRYRTVDAGGGLGTTRALTAGGRSRVDLAWTGSSYLAVWENLTNSSNTNIEMATISQSGDAGTTVVVANTASAEYQPKVAYDPATGKALITYIVDLGGGDYRLEGKFVEGTLVSPAFAIATVSPYLGIRPVHDLTYDPTNKTWLTAWDYYDSADSRREIHYLALAPDGTPLLPPAAGVSTGGATPTQLSVACSDPDAIAPNCGLLTVSDAEAPQRIRLSRVFLRSVPPWLGEITGNSSINLTLDADAPASKVVSLIEGQVIALDGTLIIGGSAEDLTSNIVGVEVSINNGAWQPATGAEAWSFAWTPGGDGSYNIRTRATDVAGNVEAPSGGVTVNVDNSPPQVNAANTSNPILGVTQDAGGRWRVVFSGTAGDSSAGLAGVEGLITPNGNGWQPATLNGGQWTLDYVLPFADEAGNAITDPTGQYTLKLRATDQLGNTTAEANLVQAPFRIDNTPPQATLNPPGDAITETLTLSGTVADPGSIAAGVQGLEIDLVPSGQITNTWQAATLQQSGAGVVSTDWEYVVPAGVEGNYLINLRGTDAVGNRNDNQLDWWSGWQGEIDTAAPRATVTMAYEGAGQAAKTVISASIQDLNLTETGLAFACPIQNKDRVYYSAPWWDEISENTPRLYELHPECEVNGFLTEPVELRVFDLYGRETVVTAELPAAAPLETASAEAVQSVAQTLPSLASTVLTPAHESALDSLESVTITGGAYAANSLKALTLTVNGTEIYSTTWLEQDSVTDTQWTTSWTPPAEGVYEFVPVVEDWTGALQTELQPVTITVDTQAPSLTLDKTTITGADEISPGRAALTGAASDTVGLEQVTVTVDGGPLGPFVDSAFFDAGSWRYLWNLGGTPDGETYTVTVEARDAVRTTTVVETVQVDLAPPVVSAPALAYRDAGSAVVPVLPGDTVRDGSTLLLNWETATDGSGIGSYYAGWTAALTPTLAALTAYAPNATLQHEATVDEASVWFAHLLTDDTNGNRTAQTAGPIYVDGPTTPDYINPVDGLGPVYRGWMDTGCSLIGANGELLRHAAGDAALAEIQKLYLSWDSTNLRLAWTGADWNADGDLFLYFDTQSGGATAAYNPYGSAGSINLPPQMGADYLVFVEDGAAATLLRWNNGAWVTEQTLAAPNYLLQTDAQPATTDLYLPFAWLGSPTSLKLVALASEEDALRVWAAMPDKNPLSSERAVSALAVPYLDRTFDLVQAYEWSAPGSGGVCAAAGQFEGSDLQTTLTSDPAGLAVGYQQHDLPALTAPGSFLDADLDGVPDQSDLPFDADPAPIGQGQTVNLTLQLANDGEADATGVVVTATARGAFGGGSQVQNVGTIAAGTSTTVSFSAQVNTALDGESAEIKIVVEDAVHGAFDWWWVQYDIDTAGPENVKIVAPAAYIGPNSNLIRGTLDDRSAVPTVDLQINGGSSQTCTDATPDDGEWLCAWNAGGAAHGAVFQLRARATDIWGNTGGYGDTRTLTVDALPPAITLSTETLDALADGRIGPAEVAMSGTVTDESAAGQAELCALLEGETVPSCILTAVNPGNAPAGDWYALAPLGGNIDGQTVDLSFTGLDIAGNRSITETRTVEVDLRAPQIAVTTYRPVANQFVPLTVLAGTAVDGSGIASLTLNVTAPDSAFTSVPLTLSGGVWSYNATFDQVGTYSLGVVGVDTFGSQSVLGSYDVEVLEAGVNLPPTVQIPPGYVVNEGATVELDSNAGDPNGDTLTYAWDLDNNGVFDDGTTATVTFDATNIDGPASYPVSVRVTDGLSDPVIGTTTVTVENVTPYDILLTLSAAEIDENGSVSLSGTFVDSIVDTHTVEIDWGDGLTDTRPVAAGTRAFGPVVHTYPDDNPTGTPSDSYEVSVVITDQDDGSATSSTLVVVKNVAPTLVDIAATSADENSLTTLSAEIVDPGAQDSFTLTVDWGDGSAPEVFNYPAGATEFSETHTYLDDDDDDTYDVTVTSEDDDNGENTYEATATVLNVAPVLEADPLSQNIQYSDLMASVTITGTDVVSDSLSASTAWAVAGETLAAGLPADLSLTFNDDCAPNGDYTQSCTWTLSGVNELAQEDYVVRVTTEDEDGGLSTVDLMLNVAPENAKVWFDPGNPVAVLVDSPGSDKSEPFALVAYVQEAPESGPFAAPGDINLAELSMTLTPVGPGSSATASCTPAGPVAAYDYSAFMTFTCEFVGLPVNTYTIEATIEGGYYSDAAEDVIVVYDPSLGFTTGGGWFYWPDTADETTGYRGDKTNFGYTMSYNKRGTNVKGNLLLIRHLPDGTIYRLKSNALEGLALSDEGDFGWASFSGKGTYLEPDWPEPIGNHTFVFYVEDHNEPGNGVDRAWVEVQDKDGTVIAGVSMPRPGSENVVELSGGNIVVPHGERKGKSAPTGGDISVNTRRGGP